MFLYSITIFLSAFLLFQVQPMIARMILPWFGGTAGVWTTCLMFFQFVLLLGYSYAHLLRLFFSPRNAWVIHVFLLGAAALLAQVVPADHLQPAGDENLTVAILTVLVVTIGLPFFVLSSTGPLVQAWQSTSHSARSPYRLYALSNLGSMLALVTYPFLIERLWPLKFQAHLWSIGFLAFAACSCWSGRQTLSANRWGGDVDEGDDATAKSADGSSLGFVRPTIWVLLAAAASVMLLATTNLMCQEVASVPFLWILPLSLYLLSFIICFDRPTWYKRRIFAPLLVISSFVAVALVHINVFAGFLLQAVGLATLCFASSMTCHGELERLKPPVKHLTWFYLLLAFGGALGGMFVAIIAPRIFSGFYEFHFALLVCLLVPMGIMVWESSHGGETGVSRLLNWTAGIANVVAATFVVCSLVYFLDPNYGPKFMFKGRNEYGLVSVVDRGDYRTFVHGQIEHGGQFTDPQKAFEHSAYYLPGSGVAIATETFRDYLRSQQVDRGLNVGILGLGAGGMMTWAKAGDQFVFFEINPLVEKIAREYFTYLSSGPADNQVILGDGRIQLQRWAAGDGQKFDLLMMDAFASDSIPVHLVTSECFDIYCQNLKKDGILVMHITNRFVDLQPVVYQAAVEHGLVPILVNYESEDKLISTRWVLMTRNKHVLDSELIKNNSSQWPDDLRSIRWTDDDASLAAILNWSGSVDWEKLKSLRDKQ